jgi:hypothetical protein
MPFTLQHPDSGLFWTSGIFGRVQLGTTPNVYTLEGNYIKNVNSGNYVNCIADLLHEGGEPVEFVFGADGTISTNGRGVMAGGFLHVMDGVAARWVKVDEVEEDVPVARSAALIEEALNAKKCECETCECDPCECAE